MAALLVGATSAATPSLDTVINLGTVGNDDPLETRIGFERVMVLVSAEQDTNAATFKGPLVLVGRHPSAAIPRPNR